MSCNGHSRQHTGRRPSRLGASRRAPQGDGEGESFSGPRQLRTRPRTSPARTCRCRSPSRPAPPRMPSSLSEWRITSIAFGSQAPSAEKPGDLAVVDLGDHAGLMSSVFASDCTAKSLFARMNAIGPEPAAEEAAQQLGALVDHVVGRIDHVGVEVLHDAAEQQRLRALPCSSSSIAVGGLMHHAVELAALHGGEPRLHRAERDDLDAVAAPALLARQLAHQPVGERADRGDADALALEIGEGLDRRIGRHQQREIGGGPYMPATPIAGAPLTRKPSPGPEPRPTSTLPAASACCICASPRKPVATIAMPSCSNILASIPTSVAPNANEFGTALPTRTWSRAKAVPVDSRNSAAIVGWAKAATMLV